MTERETIIETLDRHRGFLLQTAEGLTEEQARTASTVSATDSMAMTASAVRRAARPSGLV